jgi:hypothetical protein
MVALVDPIVEYTWDLVKVGVGQDVAAVLAVVAAVWVSIRDGKRRDMIRDQDRKVAARDLALLTRDDFQKWSQVARAQAKKYESTNAAVADHNFFSNFLANKAILKVPHGIELLKGSYANFGAAASDVQDAVFKADDLESAHVDAVQLNQKHGGTVPSHDSVYQEIVRKGRACTYSVIAAATYVDRILQEG